MEESDHSGSGFQYNIVNLVVGQNLSNSSYVWLSVFISSALLSLLPGKSILHNAEDDLQRSKLSVCGDCPQRTCYGLRPS